MTCVGLIFIMFCDTGQPATVSDFCKQAAPDVAKIRVLSKAEYARLTKPVQEGLLSLRRKYDRLCASK